MGKHYDRAVDELNKLSDHLETKQPLTSDDKMRLALASIVGVLCDIDINLAIIADALEEKKDDKA